MTGESDQDTRKEGSEEAFDAQGRQRHLEDEGYRRLKKEQGFEEISEVVHYYEEEQNDGEPRPHSDVSDAGRPADFPPAMEVPEYIVVDRDIRGATYDTKVAKIENSVVEIEQEISGISSDISLMNKNITEVAQNHGESIKQHQKAFDEVETQVAFLQRYYRKVERRQRRRSRTMRLTYLLLAAVSMSGAISAWRLGLGGVSMSFRVLTVVALIITGLGLLLAAASMDSDVESKMPF